VDPRCPLAHTQAAVDRFVALTRLPGLPGARPKARDTGSYVAPDRGKADPPRSAS
jgi:hypothetical protein